MKLVKWLKRTFLILVIMGTVLLNWGQGYLSQRGILYSDLTMLIKIFLTWIICPTCIVFSYNSIGKTKVNDENLLAATTMVGGILFLVIAVFFVCRITSFMLVEDRKEIPLADGTIMITYENLGPRQVEYYEIVNEFLYREIEE